jgi:DNA-binding LytR/AlgR family response regulator
MYSVNADPVVIHRESLNQTEQELSGYGFFRCNRGVLVNLRYCSGREENQLMISHAGIQVEISRQKLKEFDRRLIHYKMGGKDAFRGN